MVITISIKSSQANSNQIKSTSTSIFTPPPYPHTHPPHTQPPKPTSSHPNPTHARTRHIPTHRQPHLHTPTPPTPTPATHPHLQAYVYHFQTCIYHLISPSGSHISLYITFRPDYIILYQLMQNKKEEIMRKHELLTNFRTVKQVRQRISVAWQTWAEK